MSTKDKEKRNKSYSLILIVNNDLKLRFYAQEQETLRVLTLLYFHESNTMQQDH